MPRVSPHFQCVEDNATCTLPSLLVRHGVAVISHAAEANASSTDKVRVYQLKQTYATYLQVGNW